jgi:hypothetical protein
MMASAEEFLGGVAPAAQRAPSAEQFIGGPAPMAAPGGVLGAADEAARWLANAATFGYADKLAAYAQSRMGGGTYEDFLKRERERSKQAEENLPLAAKIPLGITAAAPLLLGGGVAGLGASGARLAGATRAADVLARAAAPTTGAGRIAAGAAEGAALGGLEATGRDTDVTTGAGLGAVVGGAGAAAINPIISRLTSQRTDVTPEALKKAADEAYTFARSKDILIKPQSFAEFSDEASKYAREFGYNKKLQPDLKVAYDEIAKLGNKPVGLGDVDNLRKMLGNITRDGNDTEIKAASALIGKLDQYVNNIDPSKNVLLGKGDAKDAISAFNRGRELWSRKSKADTIDNLIRRAELSAPNYSASGMENALRTEFRALAKSDAIRGFNKAEREAIEAVAKGSPTINAMRMFGKMAPRGIVSGGVLAGMAAMNPMLGAAAFAAGELGRRGATAGTTRAAESARNLMLSGQPITSRRMTPAEQALYQLSIQQPVSYTSGLLE